MSTMTFLNFQQTTTNADENCCLSDKRNISESAGFAGTTNFNTQTFNVKRSTPGIQRRPQADGRAQQRGRGSSSRWTGQQLWSRFASLLGFRDHGRIAVRRQRDQHTTWPCKRDDRSSRWCTTASVTTAEQSQIRFLPSSEGPPTNASRWSVASPRHNQHNPNRAIIHRDAIFCCDAVTSASAAASHTAITFILQPDAARCPARSNRRTLGRPRLPSDPDQRNVRDATSWPSPDADGQRRPQVTEPHKDHRLADLHFGSANPEKRFVDDHDGGDELLNQKIYQKNQNN